MDCLVLDVNKDSALRLMQIDTSATYGIYQAFEYKKTDTTLFEAHKPRLLTEHHALQTIFNEIRDQFLTTSCDKTIATLLETTENKIKSMKVVLGESSTSSTTANLALSLLWGIVKSDAISTAEAPILECISPIDEIITTKSLNYNSLVSNLLDSWKSIKPFYKRDIDLILVATLNSSDSEARHMSNLSACKQSTIELKSFLKSASLANDRIQKSLAFWHDISTNPDSEITPVAEIKIKQRQEILKKMNLLLGRVSALSNLYDETIQVYENAVISQKIALLQKPIFCLKDHPEPQAESAPEIAPAQAATQLPAVAASSGWTFFGLFGK